MTHPNRLTLFQYAEGALTPSDATDIEVHLETCDRCRTYVASVTSDTALLVSALQAEPDETPLSIPTFKHPAGLREFALANIATALIIWLAGFLWKTIFGELIMTAITWFSSFFVPDFYALLSSGLRHYLEKGTTMLDAYLGFIIFLVVALTCSALLLRFMKTRHEVSMVLGLLCLPFFAAALLGGESASALELRKDSDVITVTADEVIDDTLVAGGETIIVAGRITGDLLVAAQRIEIDGTVEGNLVAFAETVTVRGKVDGTLITAASSVDLETAELGSSVWAAGEALSVDAASSIADNLLLTGNSAVVAGTVGKDLYSFAELIEISGTLGDDLEAFGNRVRLLDGAQINGNAKLRVEHKDRFTQLDSASVLGTTEFLELPDNLENSNRYTSVKFYLWQIARIVSAILVGLALIALVPATKRISIAGGLDGLRTGAIGFGLLVGVPLAAVLVAITLIGIPFSFFTVLLWLTALYLAKIVVGIFIGRTVLENSQRAESNLMILLIGITIIIVAINLPWIGGLLNIVLTVVGFGLIAQQVYRALPLKAA